MHMCSMNHCSDCGTCIPSPMFRCANCVVNIPTAAPYYPLNFMTDGEVLRKLDRIIELLEKERIERLKQMNDALKDN